jgi:hypothetical protein
VFDAIIDLVSNEILFQLKSVNFHQASSTNNFHAISGNMSLGNVIAHSALPHAT